MVGRRGRAEIGRLAGLYRTTSGLGRIEFCLSQGMGLSTRNRYRKKQQNKQKPAGSSGVAPKPPDSGGTGRSSG